MFEMHASPLHKIASSDRIVPASAETVAGHSRRDVVRTLNFDAPLASDLLAADSAQQLAHREHRRMVANGTMWRKIAKHRTLDPEEPIAKLSEENLEMLRRKVGVLSPSERQFYHKVMQQPWFITHFTSSKRLTESMLGEDGRVRLESYEQRKKRGDSRTNAAASDLEVFAGGNFVYTCVEIGKSLKKRSTRSYIAGPALVIRAPLHSDATANAMSMHADVFDNLRAERRLRIPEHERIALNSHLARFANVPLNNDNGFARTVFYGPDAIKEGTALQVIADTRKLSTATQNRVMQREGSGELNNIVSALSRTQVMMPEHCDFENYTLHRVSSGSDNRPATA